MYELIVVRSARLGGRPAGWGLGTRHLDRGGKIKSGKNQGEADDRRDEQQQQRRHNRGGRKSGQFKTNAEST